MERDRKARFLETLAVVNAIVEVGNRIVSAINQSPGQSGEGSLKKTVEALKDVLLPENGEDREKESLKARKKLEDEIKKGPIKFRALTQPKKRPKLGR